MEAVAEDLEEETVVTAAVEAAADMVVAKEDMVADAVKVDTETVGGMVEVDTEVDAVKEDTVTADLVTQEAAVHLKATGGLKFRVSKWAWAYIVMGLVWVW